MNPQTDLFPYPGSKEKKTLDPQFAKYGHDDVLTLSCRRNPERHGAKALELEAESAKRLFYIENWPLDFRLDYKTAPTPLKKSKIAIARIDHFIKTKGAE